MKVKEKLIELGTNVFNGIKAKARQIGCAFNMRVHPVEMPRATNLILVQRTSAIDISLKQRDGKLFQNSQVVYDRTGLPDRMIHRVRGGGEEIDVNMTLEKKLVCRHMVDMELRRRVVEDRLPGVRTKESRNALFSTKNIPILQKMAVQLTESYLDLRLNAPSVYIIEEQHFGQCIADRMREMGENTSQHYAFQVGNHMVALTLKSKNGGYSISVWDPNHPDCHIKAKMAKPAHALDLQLVDFFISWDTLAYYCKGGGENDKCHWLYAVPHTWADENHEVPQKVEFTDYSVGVSASMSREKVIHKYRKYNNY